MIRLKQAFLTKSLKLKLEKTGKFQNSRQNLLQNSRIWNFYLVKIHKNSSKIDEFSQKLNVPGLVRSKVVFKNKAWVKVSSYLIG